MGTTLTGTTPQDTYDSLIKVGDNGPIGASAKTLSDGLGNDLPISVSTSAVAIGTLNVGYGTFGVYNASNSLLGIANSTSYAQLQQNGSDLYVNTNLGGAAGGNLIFRFGSGSTEHARITSAGNVGIGRTPFEASGFRSLDIDGTNGSLLLLRTSGTTNLSIGTSSGNPTIKAEAGKSLNFYTDATQVANITPNGITFGADTAAANALDDYEEGTWTMSLTPSSSGTITLDSAVNAGSYTKIGRQVTLTGLAEVLSVSSPVGTVLIVSGLPFAIGDRNLDYDTRIGGSVTVSSAGTILPRAIAGFETQSSFNIYVDTSTIAAGNQILISFTYIV